VRLAWLVVPPQLVEPMIELQRRRGGMPAALEQLALADLVERGELDRHLRRQRRRYRRRRDALLRALAARLPDAQVQGAAAGLFVVLRLADGTSEDAVLRHARAAGLALEGVGAGADTAAGPGGRRSSWATRTSRRPRSARRSTRWRRACGRVRRAGMRAAGVGRRPRCVESRG
jgi:GntR family transcriptional regulator/MocR family aminotransferase